MLRSQKNYGVYNFMIRKIEHLAVIRMSYRYFFCFPNNKSFFCFSENK